MDRDDDPESAATGAPVRHAPVRTVVVVGLGLVGGSIARGLRAAWGELHVCGVDRPAIAALAAEQGIVARGVALDDAPEVLRDADVVLLALPVLQGIAFLEQHASLLRTRIVSDTGGSKQPIVDVVRRLGLPRFVGGHPMAARAVGGLATADAALFRGFRWFLCVDDHVDEQALRTMRELIAALGARPIEMTSAEHDRDVALTSHVPHLVANAIAESVLAQGALDAAGGALQDMLKVAGAPVELWGDVFETNAPAIRAALGDVIERLQVLSTQLHDRERMRDLFARGRAARERLHGG